MITNPKSELELKDIDTKTVLIEDENCRGDTAIARIYIHRDK